MFSINSHLRKSSKVFYFKNKGDVYDKLLNLNVKVEYIPLYNIRCIISSILRCIIILSSSRKCALHLWMYHPCVIIGVIAKLLSHPKIIWSIHHSNFDAKYNKKSTLYFIYLSSFLSHIVPTVIHSCSKKAITSHLKLGYKNNFVYIPNGVDTSKFMPRYPKQKSHYFTDIKSPFVIGFFARWDPLKNHAGLLEQFSDALKSNPCLCLLLCGANIDNYNDSLVKLINYYSIPSANIKLLGNHQKINLIYKEIDLFCLPSHGEAFPVVILESLSSGVPCISTDVGDCSHILKSLGTVANINDFHQKILFHSRITQEDFIHFRQKCRKHVIDNYKISKISALYVKLYNYIL